MSESYKPIVSFATFSHVGMRRRNNQDSYATMIAENRSGWQRSGHVFVVADGMGAHAAGELASRLAVDLILHHYGKQQQARPIDNLHRALIEANNEIYRRGQANIEFRNMGTTASVLAILPEGALCAHVGDSRIYRLRNHVLEQWTFDHSLVWEMQAASGASDEDLRSSSIPKNVITRSLGPNAAVLIDLEGPFATEVGDRFLLCSDGLSGQLRDDEMGILLDLLPIDTALKAMVHLANLRGGPDNITGITVEVTAENQETETSNERPIQSSSKTELPIIPIVCGVIAFLAASLFWTVGQHVLAAISTGLGVIALFAGWIRNHLRSSSKSDESQRYGRAPYRRFPCKADAAMVDRLVGTIDAIREYATENEWSEAKDNLESLIVLAKQAEQKKDYELAVKHYAEAIVQSMEHVHPRSE